MVIERVRKNNKKLSKKELHEKINLAKNGCNSSFSDILLFLSGYISFLQEEFFIQGNDRDDLYQECSIKLINVINKYDETKGNFITFAQSSIRKHIITSINKEQAKKRAVLNQAHSLNAEINNNEDGGVVTFLETIPEESSKTPFRIIDEDYDNYLIYEIKKVLSKLEGNVFELRFIENLSYKQIAKELKLYKKNSLTGKRQLDSKSVDNAIWRSRPKIKKVLEKLGYKNRKKTKVKRITK